MPVKNTYSQRAVLDNILVAVGALAGGATEVTANKAEGKLNEINEELGRVRTGHELFLWQEEVSEVRRVGD